MTTDFTNNNTTIAPSGGFQPKTKNTPLDVRTRVNSKSDIDSIPNPFVGMKIIVLQDETNDNQMTEYVVTSLKANALGIADMKINEVVLTKDFLGVSGNGMTDEQVQQLNAAYTHSQTPHVQQSQIPTRTSQLTNDSDYTTNISVDKKIASVSGDVKLVKDKIYNEQKLANFELGGITAGGPMPASNRIRSVEFIEVQKGDVLIFKNSDNLYKYGVPTYDTDKVFISKDYGWMTTNEFIVEHNGYIKCVLAYSDNREITIDTIEQLYTDRFLIQRDVIGDINESIQKLNGLGYSDTVLDSKFWELGGITAGNNVTSDTRVRFKEKYRVKKDTIIHFNKDNSFKFGINLYDETGIYNGVDYGWRYGDFEVPIDGYFRLVLAYKDNKVITDVSGIANEAFTITTTLNDEISLLKDDLATINRDDTYNIAINSILVEYGRINGTSYVFVRIPKYINNGMQIKPKVALTSSDGTIGGAKRSTLDYAKDNNCIFTLNAGLFNTSNLQPVGQFIIDGVSLVNTPMTDDNGTPIHDEECYPLAIDAEGNLTTYPRNTDTSQMIQDGIKYAVTAWGKLVDNFQICTEDINNEIVHPGKYIRQSIGQYQNGDYCVCTVDMSRGNVQNEAGLSYEELAQIFIDKGVKFAYSLDGGGSAQTVLGKRQLNPIYEGSTGRRVPSVIQFVVE